MNLVTNAVTCLGKEGAEFARHPLQVKMIVRIAESHLEQVVIDIDHGEGLHPFETDRLQLQENQGSGRIVSQHLVRVDDQDAVSCLYALSIQYFLEQVHMSGRHSRKTGLLMPVEWPEPFGFQFLSAYPPTSSKECVRHWIYRYLFASMYLRSSLSSLT